MLFSFIDPYKEVIDPSKEEGNRDLDPGDMRHGGGCDRQRAVEIGALRMVS